MQTGIRAVFLDRDGVLNRAIVRKGKPYPPQTLEEFSIDLETRPCLEDLRRAGFRLIVVTNQPDVARGTQSQAVVDSMHEHLRRELPLDDLFVCLHDDDSACLCRKPKPGLILAAQQKHEIDLHRSFLIGDRWRDIEAGQNAGCRTVFLDYDYQERKPGLPPTASTKSLREATDWILSFE